MFNESKAHRQGRSLSFCQLFPLTMGEIVGWDSPVHRLMGECEVNMGFMLFGGACVRRDTRAFVFIIMDIVDSKT